MDKKAFAQRMRENPTKAEQRMRELLKPIFNDELKEQEIVEGFIVDFYIPCWNMIIEVDGSSHYGNYENDAKRDTIFYQAGYVVLRFSNYEVFNKPKEIFRLIRKKALEANVNG